MYKSKGFTLIELMVVIAVMAIIAMMAAPPFLAMIYNYELKKEFKELTYVLNDGRSTSRLSNKTVSIYFREPESNDSTGALYLNLDEDKYEFNMKDKKIIFRNNGVIDPEIGVFPLCFELKHIKSGLVKKIEVSQLGMQQLSDGKCSGGGA